MQKKSDISSMGIALPVFVKFKGLFSAFSALIESSRFFWSQLDSMRALSAFRNFRILKHSHVSHLSSLVFSLPIDVEIGTYSFLPNWLFVSVLTLCEFVSVL